MGPRFDALVWRAGAAARRLEGGPCRVSVRLRLSPVSLQGRGPRALALADSLSEPRVTAFLGTKPAALSPALCILTWWDADRRVPRRASLSSQDP